MKMPYPLQRQLSTLFRKAHVETAYTLGDEGELHVTFMQKARLFGIGIMQIMLEGPELKLAVANIHVGPWSGKASLANAIDAAGFIPEFQHGNTLIVVTSIYSGEYIDVVLNR